MTSAASTGPVTTSLATTNAKIPRAALVLVNLGTPKSPNTGDVRTYLREFLGDPRVLNMPAAARFALLEGIILRTRPRKSAAAYKTIWTERGSPLLFHTEDLATEVRKRVPSDVVVEIAMRYGEPSIKSVLHKLRMQGVTNLCVFPLYPQYSSASSGTAIERVYDEARKLWDVPSISVVPPFYDAPAFLDAFGAVGARSVAAFKPDHTLMSFHGLPEDHITLSDPTGAHCLKKPDCCEHVVAANRSCYRHQCVVSARGIAERVGLRDSEWTMTFQSRLTNGWVKPYTDVVLVELAKKGIKRLLVFCPAFVADCLETLEEIQGRAREEFIAAGGEDLALVPSLNAEPMWADAVVQLATRQCGWLAQS